MKTKVAIKGAEFFAYHGYYSEERKSGNTFIIDAEVTLKSFDSNDDNIFDTVNYEQLYTAVFNKYPLPLSIFRLINCRYSVNYVFLIQYRYITSKTSI